MASPIFMWLLAIEPPSKKVYASTLLFWIQTAKFKLQRQFEDNFDEGDDDNKYLMAVEHELCIVYSERSLRAPLAGQPT